MAEHPHVILQNATFGNVVELILSLAALSKGLYDVVAMSLIGSVLSNLLLVLGVTPSHRLAIIKAGIKEMPLPQRSCTFRHAIDAEGGARSGAAWFRPA